MKKGSLSPLVAVLAASALFIIFANSRLGAAELIAQWDLNEGTGTIITSQTPDGTVSEDFTTATGVTWGGSAGPASGSTNHLSFDGTNAGNTLDTNVSGAALAGTGAKTFVAWINMANVDPGPAPYGYGILSYSPAGGAGTAGDLRFLLNPNGNLRAEVSAGFFDYNKKDFRGAGWYMVAAIFGDNSGDPANTNNSRFFIGDGTGSTATPGINQIVTPTGFKPNQVINTLGTQGTGGTNSNISFVMGAIHDDRVTTAFNGGIDMVKVYNGALTEIELNALALIPAVIPEPASTALILGSLFMSITVLRRKARQIA